MFTPDDCWVWDFWLADDGEQYHLFFLYASRALHDPDARHYRASVGHAVSDDLVTWRRVADALVRSDAPAYDDLATWTGSVVRHPDGTWFLFYTGAMLTPAGQNRQRVCYATSDDLVTWHKAPQNPVLAAAGPWYETLSDGTWHDEAFRDPWVLADPGGDGWHMLITARAPQGPVDDRGVVGHAWSPDLRTWELREPLTTPGKGFAQLEVTQVEVVDGRPVLVFSCMSGELAQHRRDGSSPGVWAAPARSVLGPYDLAAAAPLTDSRYYSGRLVRRRADDRWVLLAFRHDGPDGFLGGVADPRPVHWDGDRLVAD